MLACPKIIVWAACNFRNPGGGILQMCILGHIKTKLKVIETLNMAKSDCQAVL